MNPPNIPFADVLLNWIQVIAIFSLRVVGACSVDSLRSILVSVEQLPRCSSLGWDANEYA